MFASLSHRLAKMSAMTVLQLPTSVPAFVARPSTPHAVTRRRSAELRQRPVDSHLDRRLLAHRAAIAQWMLAHGRSAPLTTLGVVIGAKEWEASITGRPFTLWSEDGVARFLNARAPAWAGRIGVDLPTDLASVLWSYLEALHRSDALHPDSAPLAVLRNAAERSGRLNRRGTRSAHPAGTGVLRAQTSRRSPVGQSPKRATTSAVTRSSHS